MKELDPKALFVVDTCDGPAVCSVFESALSAEKYDVRFWLVDYPWVMHETCLSGGRDELDVGDRVLAQVTEMVREMAELLKLNAIEKVGNVRRCYGDLG